jgi:haloacetate dehalogenase
MSAGAAVPVAVEGVRFALHRADPPRKRKTTPVLLLHGVPQTSAVWRPVIAELSRDRIVLAPDLKGLGASEVRGPYDLATLAREIAALVLHEVDGEVDVVGHDWGGSLALALAGTRPDLVRRLVVMSAPYKKVDLTRAWHVPLFALPVLPEAVIGVMGGGRLIDRMLDYAWRADRELDPELRAEYMAAYDDSRRISAMLGYYRAAVRPRLTAPVAKLRGEEHESLPAPKAASTLIVWGAGDPVLPMRIAESVATDLGPAARLVALSGVGHFVIDEAPEVVTELIASFLRASDTESA